MSQKIDGHGGSSCHGLLKSFLSLFCPDSKPDFTSMLKMAALKFRRLCGCFRSGPKIRVSRRKSKAESDSSKATQSAPSGKPIRVATFNAAMFSMAPAVPGGQNTPTMDFDIRCKSINDRPKSILKQQSIGKSKLRVSLNVPDNEISVERSKQLNSGDEKGKAPMGHSFRNSVTTRSDRSVLDVLRESGADLIALQNVKAVEEKGMKPLSDLAEALGMKYVFAESWAPEYGNAILSRWPIKQWRVHKIFDNTDFRNVLKAVIEVPKAGLVNFHCTYLDHLDETWRMKQINSILQSTNGPHILAGGFNSLDETDYSAERWRDIVKYYEEIGKPTPKVEVMNFMKEKQYVDAKNFAGECEAVVVVAKGQGVQGTCKYGTRVDYILASPRSPYKFVPGSYGVISSKGTSDHHIVKVDVMIADVNETESTSQPRRRVVKINNSSSKGIWRTD